MPVPEIESFIFKFRNLLYSGKDARLEIKSESGKVTMNLTVEVEIPAKLPSQSRNGPARQRRREQRATARAAAAAENEAAQTEARTEQVEVVEETIDVLEDAAEAKDLKAAKVSEPIDEITNEFISGETPEKFCESVSIIPIRKVSGSDDAIEKVIKDKFSEKAIKIHEVCLHRSIEGTFIRFDARIDPTSGRYLRETDFGFLNCEVIPIFGRE